MNYNWIDLLEMTDLDDLDLDDNQLVEIANYLLKNLINDHSMPGKVYDQMMGICIWYKYNNLLSLKQRYWMYIHLKEYISQRDFSMEF